MARQKTFSLLGANWFFDGVFYKRFAATRLNRNPNVQSPWINRWENPRQSRRADYGRRWVYV